MVGTRLFDASNGSGTISAALTSPLGFHWCAPAGLLVSSQSNSKRFSKKSLLHFVGVEDQITSRPLVMASFPTPEPKLLFQPKPCSSTGAPSGSAPTYFFGSAAPCVFPKV